MTVRPRVCCAVLCVFAFLCAGLAFAAGGAIPVFHDDFEQGQRWEPSPGVRLGVVRVEGQGGCLRVEGRQDDAWNYAHTAPFRLDPGGKYRITATVLTERARPSYPPFLKVEFIAREGDRWDHGTKLGRARTSPYDLQAGGWQTLVGEFVVPEGAEGGWIALEKGTKGRVALEAYVGDVKVVRIAELSRLARLRSSHAST